MQLLSLSLLVLLLASMCLIGVRSAGVQTDQAESKLQAANAAINQAFTAVLDAEKVGENVTDLLDQINTAQVILAQADNSFRTGDTKTAATKADSVLPIAQHVTLNAQDAKQTATVSSQNVFWTTKALTIIGIVIFVLVLFLVWRRFKQNYIKGLSQAKPEVVNQ